MRNKFLPILLLLVLVCGAARSQEKTDTVPDSVSVVIEAPMLDYATPRKYVIRNVDVLGVEFLDKELLINQTGIIKGDSVLIPGNYLSDVINRLWSQRYFSDIKIAIEPVGDDQVDVKIYLKERPRVYKWQFEGIRKGQAQELQDDILKLKRGSELSDYVVEKNKILIKKWFSDKGFRNTEVDVKIENDSVLNNAVNLTFVINRNDRVKIGEIKFTGNEIFPDKRLRKTFKKTHQKNINFFQSFKLNDTEYENDKDNLIDFYNSKGYRNASIVSDSIYKIDGKRIGLVLNIDEGNKYYFRNISWVGNSKYPTEELQRYLGINKGDTYDKKTLHKRLGIGREENPEDMSVKSMYQNEGYLMSAIDPAEIIIGEDSIDLEIKVFEGKPFTINEVNISGNLRLNDEVIRRELYTHPGELYSRELLMRTIRQLAQTQHFNPEAIQPDIAPVSNELVDISWPLEEQGSDQLEISGGWGAGMFIGSVGIKLNNLSIKNFFKKGAWRPYPQGQNQQLAIRAQSNGKYYKSFSLSFTEPWLGGRRPNSLSVSTYYSDETNASYIWQTASRHFRTLGAAVGLGHRLNWPDPYFTIYNEIAYQAYSLSDWYSYFIISDGICNTFALKTTFSRNTVDQPIYPRRGSEFTLSLAVTPPYSLFDKKDYSDSKMSDQDRYRWIEYHKWKFKAQWYYPVSRDQKLVLMAKAEMGYLGHYNKNKKSPFEGFDVGGDGMSNYNVYGVDVIGMRGYENSALNPANTNDYARGYNKYTAELRFPFILKPSSTIYGLVFAEAGNAFSTWKDFRPFELKRALGAGVRMYLPVVGMIGVDWGWGFDNAASEAKRSGGHFHFVIGMQF